MKRGTLHTKEAANGHDGVQSAVVGATFLALHAGE